MKIQGSTGSNQISALNKREFEVRKEEFLGQALPELKSRGMSVIRIEDNITMRDPLGSIYGYVSIIWEADTDDPNYQRGQSEPLNCNSPWNRSYSKRGCYVATCVYGSYDCPQVWTLRRYRDYILARTWYGRAFIRTYYTISPTLVKWFGHTKWFKDMWKPHLDNMIRKRYALTQGEEQRFLDYLKQTEKYRHWYPIFAVMLGTGMRVGETAGLRWCDIDLENETIDINHTLVNYRHAVGGCYSNVHTPKTRASVRKIPMLGAVKQAFIEEKNRQKEMGIRCLATVDGYTDFIFINRFGDPQHQGTLNKAIRRIIRDCNDEALSADIRDKVLLPPFSCHTLRHTFTTRMCEKGVNIKVIQDVLGHADVSTTLNIYADATKELKKAEFASLDAKLKADA